MTIRCKDVVINDKSNDEAEGWYAGNTRHVRSPCKRHCLIGCDCMFGELNVRTM